MRERLLCAVPAVFTAARAGLECWSVCGDQSCLQEQQIQQQQILCTLDGGEAGTLVSKSLAGLHSLTLSPSRLLIPRSGEAYRSERTCRKRKRVFPPSGLTAAAITAQWPN